MNISDLNTHLRAFAEKAANEPRDTRSKEIVEIKAEINYVGKYI